MTEFWSSTVTILTAIIGIAGLAILVSKNANTTNVLGAGGQAFSGALATALSPVTGGSTASNVLSGLNTATNLFNGGGYGGASFLSN